MDEVEAEESSFALSDAAWNALLGAASEVEELLKGDKEILRAGEPASSTELVAFMPRRFLLRYDGEFAERLERTATDLNNGMQQRRNEGWAYPYETFLNSVVEEMLMARIIALAVENAASPEVATELRMLDDVGFEDRDFEWLYNLSHDGITDDPRLAEQLGFANLGFEEWFEPFR
ncbi:MAG: hypothetical protein LC776_12325 [Acidobacteria bacterium]|nr:hypothetical protein [Acidobacteriota bacterium]